MKVISLLTLLSCVLVSACSPQPSQRLYGDSTMGTSWSVKIIATDFKQSDADIKAAIQARLDDIEAKMSNWRDDSEVSRFNAMPAGCLAVSVETATVVNQALVIAEQSGGALDITLGPLIELWGFGKKIGTHEVPQRAEIDTVLGQFGYQALSLEADKLCKSRDAISINVSAVAKGYAVDEVAQTLENLGYDRYLVEVGGELFGKGFSPRNTSWAIGVEKPLVGERAVMGNVIIPLDGKGLATSGDYRIFFEKDGKRYSHLLDPSTGMPVTHQVASVSVLAESSMVADGYATAMQVMGTERAIELANSLGLEVMVLEYAADGQINAVSSERWAF